jgi:hypothetical protein
MKVHKVLLATWNFNISPLEHDPEKWQPDSLATNAKHLRGNHAQTK